MREGYLPHSQLALTAGTVLGVGSITENSASISPAEGSDLARSFTAETPLHPAAAEFLTEAFSSGWANPTKIHHASRKTAILISEARAIFCQHLGVTDSELFLLGDTPLGFHLGISGFMAPGGLVHYPATARSMAYAVAHSHPYNQLGVDNRGHFDIPEHKGEDLLVWQAVNAETGVRGRDPQGFSGKIFVDAVNSFQAIPEWSQGRWSAALWDSRAWSGPAGFTVFALRDRPSWRNPLPHNDSKPTSGNISVPLMIASAIALEAYTKDFEANRRKLLALNNKIRAIITERWAGSHVAGVVEETEPHLITLSLPAIESQWLVTELDRLGFAIDTGSACMSMNMQPSHVLAAMGLPVTGNIRLRLRPDHSESDIDTLLNAVVAVSEAFAD